MKARVLRLRILVDVLDPPSVERRRTPLRAVDDVALIQLKLHKTGIILAGHIRNKRYLLSDGNLHSCIMGAIRQIHGVLQAAQALLPGIGRSIGNRQKPSAMVGRQTLAAM